MRKIYLKIKKSIPNEIREYFSYLPIMVIVVSIYTIPVFFLKDIGIAYVVGTFVGVVGTIYVQHINNEEREERNQKEKQSQR